MTIKNLFICADCGARSGFVGAWLLNNLSQPSFDVGKELGVFFYKEHWDIDNKKVKNFVGPKIRIKPDLKMLGIHMYLSLVKDVYGKIDDFTFSEYSIETFTKMYISALGWFEHDLQIDESLYDKVINFSDTYNTNFMVDLYKWYNSDNPSQDQIDILIETNKINFKNLELNHSCNIAALLIIKEKTLGLKEINRRWSIVDEYQNSNFSTLYDRVLNKIDLKNYNQL
jgi:hypothetical protein